MNPILPLALCLAIAGSGTAAGNTQYNGTASDESAQTSAVTETYQGYSDYSAKCNEIGMRSDLSDKQKVAAMQAAFENVTDKSDINVPADARYLKGFDESGKPVYDWPPYLGFDKDSITSVSPENPFPDRWDRYGYMGGTNFCSVPDDGIFTYSERALPYVENPYAYHCGSFNNSTYFDKIDAVRSSDMKKLNKILASEGVEKVDKDYFDELCETYEDYLSYAAENVGDDITADYGLIGTTAKWEDMTGGSYQLFTPFSGFVMIRLGIMSED